MPIPLLRSSLGPGEDVDHLAWASADLEPRDLLAPDVGSLAASPVLLPFTAIEDGLLPPAQTLSVSNPGGLPLTNVAIGVSYGSGDNWAIVGPLSATTLNPGDTATASVSVDHRSLSFGDYAATLSASSPDAASAATVSVTLHVDPSLTMDVTGDPFGFTAQEGQPAPAGQTLVVTNTGHGTVLGLATTILYDTGSGWLAVGPLSRTTLAPGQIATASVTVNHAGISGTGQTLTATIRVNSANATNSPQDVPASMLVLAPAPPAPTGTTIKGRVFLTDATATDGATKRNRAQLVLKPGMIPIADAASKVAVVFSGTSTQVPCISRALRSDKAGTPAIPHFREVDANGVYSISTATARTPLVLEVEWDAAAYRNPTDRYDIVVNTTNTAGTGGLSFQGFSRTNNGGQFAFHTGGAGFDLLYPLSVIVPGERQIRRIAAGQYVPVAHSITGSLVGGALKKHIVWLYWRETQADARMEYLDGTVFTEAHRYHAQCAVEFTVPNGTTVDLATDDLAAAGCVITRAGATGNADGLRRSPTFDLDGAMHFVGPAIWLPAASTSQERQDSADYLCDTVFGVDPLFGPMKPKYVTDGYAAKWQNLETVQSYQIDTAQAVRNYANRTDLWQTSSSAAYDAAVVYWERWARTAEPWYFFVALTSILVQRNNTNIYGVANCCPTSLVETFANPRSFAVGYLLVGALPDPNLQGGTQDLFRDALRNVTAFFVHREFTNNGSPNYNPRTTKGLHECRTTARAFEGLAGMGLLDMACPAQAPQNTTTMLTFYYAANGGLEQAWKDGFTILENTMGTTGRIYQSDIGVSGHFYDLNNVEVNQTPKMYMIGMLWGAHEEFVEWTAPRMSTASAPSMVSRANNIVLKSARYFVFTDPYAYDGDKLETVPQTIKAVGQREGFSYVSEPQRYIPNNPASNTKTWSFSGGVWVAVTPGTGTHMSPADGIPAGPTGWAVLNGLEIVGMIRASKLTIDATERQVFRYRAATLLERSGYYPLSSDKFTGTNNYCAAGQYGKMVGEATKNYGRATAFLADYLAHGEL